MKDLAFIEQQLHELFTRTFSPFAKTVQRGGQLEEPPPYALVSVDTTYHHYRHNTVEAHIEPTKNGEYNVFLQAREPWHAEWTRIARIHTPAPVDAVGKLLALLRMSRESSGERAISGGYYLSLNGVTIASHATIQEYNDNWGHLE